MRITLEDYTFIPLAWVSDAPPLGGLVEVLIDRWWATRGGDELAFHRGRSPQCNRHESIVRKIGELMPWPVDVVLVPRVVLPVVYYESVSSGEYMGMDWRYVLPTEAPK